MNVTKEDREIRFNAAPGDNRYLELKALRENIRKDYIARGILDDPESQKVLAEARAIIGTCTEKCPEFEIEEREYQNGLDRLEMIPGTRKADKQRVVKTFHRSAAGNEQPLPEDVRTPEALERTMEYLLEKILANDDEMKDTHQFIRDRTRSIRQDYSVQNLKDRRAIRIYEQIARYHILATHMLSENENFVEQQEMEQLRKTLQSLIEFYDENRIKGDVNPSENEAEIRAYYLMVHMKDMDGRRMVEKLPEEIFWSEIIQQTLKLVRYAQTSNSTRGRTEAPNLFGAQNRFSRFFKEIESERTPFLLACVAEYHFVDVQRAGLRTMNKAILYQGGKEYPVEKAVKMFGFNNAADCIAFCRRYNLRADEQGGIGFGEKGQERMYVMEEPAIKPKRKKHYRIIENKRLGMTNEHIVVQGVGAGVGVGVGVGMGMSGYRQQNFCNQSQFATQTVGFKKQTESQFQTQAQPQPRPQPQPQPQFQFKPIQTQPTQPTQPKLETKLQMQLQPENSMTKDLTKQPQLSGFQFGKAPLKSTIEANAKVQKSIESVNPIGLSQKINENIGKLTGMENQQTSSTARDDFGGFKFGAPQKFEATAQPSVQIGNVAKPQISPEPSEIQGEVRVNWEYNRRESITTMELARFLYTDIIGELVDQVVFKEYRKRQKAEKMASELVQPIVEQLISEIVYQETYTNVFAELCNTKQQQFRKQSLRRLGLAKFKEMAKQYKAAKKQKEYINSVIYGDQTIKLVTPRSYRHIEKALRQSRGKSNKRLKISHDLWDSAGLGKTVSQTLGWSGNPGFYGQIRANIQLVTVGHKTQLFERWVWWHIDDKISAEDPSVSPEYITSNQSNIQLRFFRSKTIESADAYILLVDPGLTSKDTKANGQAAAASHPPHVVDQLCHLLLELAQQPNQPMVALLALSDCTEQSLVVADAVESSVRLLFSRDEVQAEQNRRVKLFGLDISEHSVVDDLTNPFMWLVAGLSQKMLGSDTYLLPNQFFFRQAYDLYDHLFVPLFSSSINISHIPLSSGVLALIVGFINHIISQICSLVDVSAPELSTSYPACKSGSAFQSTAFVRRLLAQYSSALSLALNVDVDLQSIQGLVSFDSGTFLHGDIFGKDQRSCNEVYVSPTFVYEFYHLVYLNILETLNLHVLKRYNYVAKPTMDLLLYSTCEHTKWCISQYLHWYNSNHTALTAHIESLVLQRNKLHSKTNVDNRNVVTNGVGASIKNKSVCGGIVSSSTRKSITSLYSSINDALNLL